MSSRAAASKVFRMGNVVLPRPAYGAMGLSVAYAPNPADVETYKDTLRKSVEVGCTVWNTADLYGFGANEELLGSILREGDNRSKVFLVTKFGGRWDGEGKNLRIDGTAEYAAKALEASIARLGSAPDAWALHRVDKKTPIEESVRAMEAARKAGKTRFIGVSECSAETLRRASMVAKIDFVEIECFLTGRYTTRNDFQPGDYRSNLPRFQQDVWEHNLGIVREFERLAKKKRCTPAQLSLAWLMAQGDHIVPIPGTKSEKYLVENFASREIELSAEEMKEIREVVEANKPLGHRYSETTQKLLDE
ncbi:hypothetical protein MNV49_001630 [Pseudohyphozyma bogoriensis]|nr:hypothetical protein MNV49_001630 [Pseudohyphozyma bogoriensis]